MTSHSPLYADQILNLAVTGPLVRIEFAAIPMPDARQAGAPELVPSQVVVIPIDGFIRSFGIFEQAMKKLIESGVVKVQDDKQGTSSPGDRRGTGRGKPQKA